MRSSKWARIFGLSVTANLLLTAYLLHQKPIVPRVVFSPEPRVVAVSVPPPVQFTELSPLELDEILTVSTQELAFGETETVLPIEICNVSGWVAFYAISSTTAGWLLVDHPDGRLEADECVTLDFEVVRAGFSEGQYAACLAVTPYHWPNPTRQACTRGPLADIFPGCEGFDRDLNGHVDLRDYSLEQCDAG